MGDPKGFLTTQREVPKRRPVDVRIRDWKEVYEPQDFQDLQKQAGRCMDCGIPFCHQGCPLGNLIPFLYSQGIHTSGYRFEDFDPISSSNEN